MPMSFDQRAGGTQFPNLLQSVQRALRILEVIAESPTASLPRPSPAA